MLHHKTDPCPSTLPTIASEKNTISLSEFPARAALIDFNYDGKLPEESTVYNYWAGAPGLKAEFVIDLGCEKTLIKIEMRNMLTHYG